MKHVTVIAVIAAAAVGLPFAALESEAAQGSTAQFPRAGAGIAAAQPPRLVALERKMRLLRINTARLSVKEISRGPVKKGEEPFQVEPASRGRSHEGGGTKSRSPRAHGSSKKRIVTQTLLSARVEISRSPSLELTHERLFGALRFRVRRIGEEVYTHEPLIAKTDGGRPWVSRKRSKKEAEGSLLGNGRDGVSGKLAKELAGARSISEVGPRTIDRRPTVEFYATLDPRRVYSKLFHAHSHGDAKLLRKLRKAVARAKVTLRVWFERDGLPVDVVEEAAYGKDEIRSTERILATEIPVSVQPPPAAKTISEEELKKLEQRPLKEPESLGTSRLEGNLGEPAAIG